MLLYIPLSWSAFASRSGTFTTTIDIPSTKTIDSLPQLKAELTEPIEGISIVVVNVPDRDANADQLKGIYNNISSM
jgi:hypothetical protein